MRRHATSGLPFRSRTQTGIDVVTTEEGDKPKMTMPEPGPGSAAAALAAFRADLPLKAPNARSLAATIENPGCTARRVLDSAGVDKVALATRIGTPLPQEQSVFAINRGNRFEADLKADDYAALIELLRQAKFEVDRVEILRLRNLYPISPRNPDIALEKRAAATRSAILGMAAGESSAPNLIDGGALRWDFGGAVARLETDGIAWRLGGRIHIIEIKSFPLVDGRGDPEKVGAAAWQAAVYVSAITDMLAEQGFDTNLVSTEVLLVCPRNTSLTPTMAPLDVARQTRSLRRLLAGRRQVGDVLAALGDDATLDTAGMSAEAAATHLADVLERLGTNYLPSCLAACPLAYHCRDRARATGNPACLGPEVRTSLAGVQSLPRVLELAVGASPGAGESDAAAMLMRAARLLRAADSSALVDAR